MPLRTAVLDAANAAVEAMSRLLGDICIRLLIGSTKPASIFIQSETRLIDLTLRCPDHFGRIAAARNLIGTVAAESAHFRRSA